MHTATETDVLEFKLNFKVTKKVKSGFLGLKTREEDFRILNDGELDDRESELTRFMFEFIFSERKNRVGNHDSAFRCKVSVV